MTKPIRSSEAGLEPHWKIRVVLPGAILHLASWNEPQMLGEFVAADLIEDHEYGDTVGRIDWREVVAVTWRYSP
jgi:hypothetical protein